MVKVDWYQKLILLHCELYRNTILSVQIFIILVESEMLLVSVIFAAAINRQISTKSEWYQIYYIKYTINHKVPKYNS